MRHSDINLTMSRYSHTLTGQEAKAIADLPNLSIPNRQKAVATGTDGKLVDTVQNDSKKLTPTASSGCNQLSADVSLASDKCEKTGGQKSLQSGKLSNNKGAMSSSDTEENKIRLEGFGPPTFGSVDRRSIQLSYRRNVKTRFLHCNPIPILP